MVRLFEALKRLENRADGSSASEQAPNLASGSNSPPSSQKPLISTENPPPTSVLGSQEIIRDPDSMELTIAEAEAALVDMEREHGAYGHMARNILAQWSPLQNAVLMFTSPEDRTGKTETLFPLAEALAEQSHQETLLIDAQFRQPDLSKESNDRYTAGLYEALRNQIEWHKVVHPHGTKGLSFLPNRGPYFDSRPSSPRRFSTLLEEMRKQYPRILIEVSSLAHPETIDFLKHGDGIYLIIRLGHTTKGTLEQAEAILHQWKLPYRGAIAVGDVM